MWRLRTLATLVLLSACLPLRAAPAPTEGAPYVLDDTEVRHLHASGLNRDYALFVSLPASYRQSPDRRFPVVFVTDANYAFPLVRSIARRVGDGGRGLEDFILVGLSYADGDTPEYSRRRDYTPTANGTTGATSDMPGRAPVFGQAEAYRQFIAKDVFPFVAKQYRADMTRKVIAGHSYGALFAVHALLTEPTMFEHYIVGSPSLWFDGKVMFDRERRYAESHRDMKAHVLMAAGAYETIVPRSTDPRYNDTEDMVRDMQSFERALKGHRYPGLQVKTQVIADEDHLTAAPAILTRGLLWALPPRRP